MERAAVVGVGSIGHGIAELLSLAGFEVTAVDTEEGILKLAEKRIRRSLELLGRIELLEKIRFTTHLREVRGAEFILEAVPERMELKKEVFRKLDELAPSSVLSTNSSSLSVTELARATCWPGRVVGTHFVHFPQDLERGRGPEVSILLPLVEVVEGELTEEETLRAVEGVVRRMGKHPERVRDTPAYVANRFLARAGLEAGLCLAEGAGVEEVDAMAVEELGTPAGIFQMLDMAGLDVCLDVLSHLQIALPEGYFVPPPLEAMVEGGYLGRKSGKGFYDYSCDVQPLPPAEELDPLRLLAPLVNEACWMIEEGTADAAKIERVLRLSFFPRGLLSPADLVGVERLVEKLRELEGRLGYPWYRPRRALLEREEKGFSGLLPSDLEEFVRGRMGGSYGRKWT